MDKAVIPAQAGIQGRVTGFGALVDDRRGRPLVLFRGRP
jgi:hypothetical protein